MIPIALWYGVHEKFQSFSDGELMDRRYSIVIPLALYIDKIQFESQMSILCD